jgi:hypothetical protein
MAYCRVQTRRHNLNLHTLPARRSQPMVMVCVVTYFNGEKAETWGNAQGIDRGRRVWRPQSREGVVIVCTAARPYRARRINQHLILLTLWVLWCACVRIKHTGCTSSNYCACRPLVGRHCVLYDILVLYKRERLLCESNVARFGRR